jgi:hypothetical protein
LYRRNGLIAWQLINIKDIVRPDNQMTKLACCAMLLLV